MALDPRELLNAPSADSAMGSTSIGGTRRQRMQRLQIGLFGLATMIVLVALVDIILSSAQQNQAALPEDLSPVTTEDLPPPPPRDPLVEAGVVPNLPIEADPVPGQAQIPAPIESDSAQTSEEVD